MAATTIFFHNVYRDPSVYGPVDGMLTAVDPGPWPGHPGYVAVSKQSATVLKELGSPVVMTEKMSPNIKTPQYAYLVPGWIVDLWDVAERMYLPSRLSSPSPFRGGRRAAEDVVRALMKMSEEDRRAARTMVECVRSDPYAVGELAAQFMKGKWWNDDA